MKSILALTCCLALAITATAANEQQGKKKKGAQGQGGGGQAAHGAAMHQGKGQGQGAGKHAKGAGQQGMGKKAGQLNAGQGANAGGQMRHHGAGAGGGAGKGKGHAGKAAALQTGAGGKVQTKHFATAKGPNPKIASAHFNASYRIAGAHNWRGAHYEVFRVYTPAWHERVWWVSHYPRIVLIGGGWYFWNSGYWYPAWGYDSVHAYYPYDGPIYAANDLPPDQVIANVQSTLQSQQKPNGEPYYQGDVDGLLGPLTRAALADYQADHGLEPTAAIDEPTMQSLGFA